MYLLVPCQAVRDYKVYEFQCAQLRDRILLEHASINVRVALLNEFCSEEFYLVALLVLILKKFIIYQKNRDNRYHIFLIQIFDLQF